MLNGKNNNLKGNNPMIVNGITSERTSFMSMLPKKIRTVFNICAVSLTGISIAMFGGCEKIGTNEKPYVPSIDSVSISKTVFARPDTFTTTIYTDADSLNDIDASVSHRVNNVTAIMSYDDKGNKIFTFVCEAKPDVRDTIMIIDMSNNDGGDEREIPLTYGYETDSSDVQHAVVGYEDSEITIYENDGVNSDSVEVMDQQIVGTVLSLDIENQNIIIKIKEKLSGMDMGNYTLELNEPVLIYTDSNGDQYYIKLVEIETEIDVHIEVFKVTSMGSF